MTRSLRPLACLAFAALLAGCASARPALPAASAEPDLGAAEKLLAASVEAHGGDAYAEIRDIAVSYEGEWGWWVQRLQPVLTDTDHRKSSEERLLLADGVLYQRHRGPGGLKTVLRDADGVEVRFAPAAGEELSADDEQRAAAALVADVYEMFLLGPSYFLHRGERPSPLSPVREDGKTYERLSIRVVPGFGFSAGDLAELWIDADSRILFRVLFTIDGLASTRGAAVDTTFHDHRRIGGFLWPTRFVERVRAPLRVFAHRWWMTGFDLDRGLEPADLSAEEPSAEALRPAEALAAARP